MSFRYVKSSYGTRTAGGGIAQKTGVFETALTAAEVYSTIAEACNDVTPLAHGDIICVSDLHSYNSGGGNITYNVPQTVGEGVLFISVDDLAIDTYKYGATETPGISNDYILVNGFATLRGFEFMTSGNGGPRGNGTHVYEDCTLKVRGTSDAVGPGSAGHYLKAKNCNISAPGSQAPLHVSTGAVFEIVGGAVTNAAAPQLVYGEGFASGGGTLDISGFDASLVSDYIVGAIGAVFNDNTVNVKLANCKLSGTLLGWTQEAFIKNSQTLLVTNSASTSAEAEYQYYYNRGGNAAEDETGVYRTNTFAFLSGAKCSYKVATTSFASKNNPFVFTLKPRYTDLTDAASDTLTIHFASDAALDNSQVYAVVRYPTAADLLVIGNANNAPTVETRLGLSGTPTSYTDNAEGWFNGPANTYSLSVTVTGGAACVPVIDLYIAYDTGINPLYVCPKIDVS